MEPVSTLRQLDLDSFRCLLHRFKIHVDLGVACTRALLRRNHPRVDSFATSAIRTAMQLHPVEILAQTQLLRSAKNAKKRIEMRLGKNTRSRLSLTCPLCLADGLT